MTVQNLYDMFYDWMAEDTVRIYDGPAPFSGYVYHGYCEVPKIYRDKVVAGFSYKSRINEVCIWLKNEQ